VDPEDVSTDALVDRASHGDDLAVDSLLGRYLPQVERFLRGKASPDLLARESGADLAQSVCREALERLADGRLELRGEAAFKQWLYRAAELKLKNRWRYWQAERRAPGREQDALGDEQERALYRSIFSPSRQAIRHEEIERFHRALEQLEEQPRQAIALFHLKGCSHAEIAQELGISESYSRTLLARGLARLAKLARGEAS